jgi:hypothetical protein
MASGNRGVGLVLAALVGAVAVGQARPFAATGKAPEARSGEKTKAKDEGERSRGANGDREALPVAAGVPCCIPVKVEPDCDDGDRLLSEYTELYGATSFQFLVALVPDPEESGHTDYFDAVLEGVEDAVAGGTPNAKGVRHYVRDHHWFPWSGSDKEKNEDRCWERVPGVVLYRPLDAPGVEPLAVLVVGETPTWGVREKQLLAALANIEEKGVARDDIAILGPTFSGSAPSLAAVLAKHVEKAKKPPEPAEMPSAAPPSASQTEPREIAFRLVSGTATGELVKPTLEVLAESERGFRASYRSAIPEDAQLLTTMLDYLASIGGYTGERVRTVVFTESMTAYGESVTRASTEILRLPLQIRFPPNLASIRSVYLEVDQSDPKNPVLVAPSGARATPQERLGELSDQTPITHDLALASVLRELKAQSVRNVGIVATDARDVVFMAGRIKQQLPDVRLFTIGLDIRYLHPDHNSVLNGMLVVHASDEPIVSTTVRENPMSRGVYAAGRDLLANERRVPRALVSLVGNGVLWQMSRSVAPDGDSKRPVFMPPRSFRRIYWASVFVFAFAFLFVAGPEFVIRAASLRKAPDWLKNSGFVRQRTSYWFGHCGHRDLQADDAFATASFLTVALAMPIVVTAASLRLGHGTAQPWILGIGVALVMFFTWWRTRKHIKNAGPSARLLAIIAATIAALGTSLGCTEPREATFALLSGGSPLIAAAIGLGMLLLATICWRARLRLLDNLCFGAREDEPYFDPVPPPGTPAGPPRRGPITRLLGEKANSEIAALESKLHRVLRSPWSCAPVIPAVVDVLLVSSVGFVLLVKSPITFETGFRHWVLIIFVTVCILPITTAFARILVTSRFLMRLLRSVSCFPVVGALRKLPPELARRLEVQLARGGREVGELMHPIQTLLEIGQGDSTFEDAAKWCKSELDAELAYEAGAPLSGKPRTPHGPALLVEKLLLLAETFVEKRDGATPIGKELIDEYQARLLAIFVSRYVRHLRLMVPAVLIGSVLAILMTSLYFVQPQQMISTICFLWVTVMVLGIVAMYAALARDLVISNIGQTTAGALEPNLGLVVRGLGVALVPITSLLATKYPEFAFWVSQALGTAGRLFN